MSASAFDFHRELRLNPRSVLVALAILGLLLIGMTLLLPKAFAEPVTFLALALYAVAVLGWLVLDRWPEAGRWFTVLGVAALAHLAGGWLQMPQLQAWSAFSVALAAALLGLPAALLVAILESLFAIVVVATGAGMGGGGETAGIASAWAMYGVMRAVYGPMAERTAWLERYFAGVRETMEEARVRRSELELANERLTHANRQLALAEARSAALRRIAEDAGKAKETFVANVSHELRTPLNIIMGLVDLMVGSPEVYSLALPPKMREDLEVVRGNCEHLSAMVNDVLDLTRTEAGRLTLHRERVSMAGVIERAAAVGRPLLDKKQLYLRVDLPADLPDVYCDRVRVQQVLLNLLNNAARFTEAGGVTVTVTRHEEHLQVAVADTGPGIAQADAEKLFEPFSQVSSPLWHGAGGSGLGLAISKRFVTLHGGRMWLESVPGSGSTFYFTLPFSPEIAPDRIPTSWIKDDWVWREPAFLAPSGLAGGLSKRPRLVVRDDTGGLAGDLARLGDEVEVALVPSDGDLAAAIADGPGQAVLINAASLTALLPAVLAACRAAPATPVIGCSVPAADTLSQAAGAAGYLVKPVSRAALQQALKGMGRRVRRVLVIGDDGAARSLLARQLAACDAALAIYTAPDGAAALAMAGNDPPDLLFVDMAMLGADGGQVLQRLRHEGHFEQTPAFLISAQDPADRPAASPAFVVALEGGVTTERLLRCSLALPSLLLSPAAEGGPRRL